jgi:hypothetical protein
MNLEALSALVRPVVTLGFVSAQIATAGAWTQGANGAEQAFAALSPFTSMVVTYYFKERSEQAAARRVAGEEPTPEGTA